MAIKYQVFISSTYEDLRIEREQVLKATLEMGHIPVGMEMFSAADDEQWKIITRQIDDSDYYAVLVAHRYGSTVGGVSYTEKEYDYAASKGIPIIGFVIENDASWPTNKVDTDPAAKDALDRFKAKVKMKPVSHWTTATDLHGKFSIAFMKQITTTPRPGWTRATDVAGPEVVKELARLSSENATLRSHLSEAMHKAEDDSAAERNRIIQILKKNNVELHFFYADGNDWEDEIKESMYSIFFLLAPELMIEKTTDAISHYVGIMLQPNKNRNLRSDRIPVPSNHVKHWVSDFIALDLLEPSPRRHTVSDTEEYWSLTEIGREVYTQIRRAKLEGTRVDEKVLIDLPSAKAPTNESRKPSTQKKAKSAKKKA